MASPLRGSEEFTQWFVARGPSDRRGRSLRDLDLQTKLFKYPCSYLIYSDAFNALPEPLKTRLYQRLHEILTGQDANPDFQKMPVETRRAILEILADTKAGLPECWKK